ncbi:YD repeat protein [Rippkaea orientalis PCC 8801]|uniref:YD repeat protein n=1 Tax=Rippkaea orientalis (strain PCC 8801 / RF-1) TaxID=41431 RepID=B7JZN5_RIPO1|nr:RHS repeat domain-containing protein [Rippkaea orientalis]ACK64978.1 YD repeat protein [Rippkaea orientalis PCC 8801]
MIISQKDRLNSKLRIKVAISPPPKKDKYFYDANGLLIKSVNRRGQEIAYEYNDKYQITKETHSDGSIIEYEYGATDGLLTFISRDNTGKTTRFEFDEAKNESSIIHHSGFVHSYRFDELGRKTQIIFQDGTKYLNKINDKLGRVLI